MTRKELLERYPSKEFGVVNVEREYSWDNKYKSVIDKGWSIYLEHSCDQWVIGNIENARKMADNLQSAIQYCRDIDSSTSL